MKKIFTLLIFILTCSVFAKKTISIDLLKQQIQQTGSSGDHEKSIKLICDFISDPNVSSTELYEAYLMKAGIYRKLYKYEHALNLLDLALKEGIKGRNKETVQQEIKAEK